MRRRAHTVPTLRTVTSGDRGLVGRVHAFREGAEVVVEDLGVDVEGHRCGGVTEHPLDRLDVRAAGYQQARGGVPKVVRAEVLEPGGHGRRVEEPPPEVARAQYRAAWRSQDEVVRALALTAAGQGLDEDARDRHGALLVRLGRSVLDGAADLRSALGDSEPLAEKSTRRPRSAAISPTRGPLYPSRRTTPPSPPAASASRSTSVRVRNRGSARR